MHTCIPLLLRSPHTTKPMSLIPNPTAPSPIGALDGAHIPRAHDIEDSRRRRGAVEAPVLMTALRPSARPRGCGAGGAA